MFPASNVPTAFGGRCPTSRQCCHPNCLLTNTFDIHVVRERPSTKQYKPAHPCPCEQVFLEVLIPAIFFGP